MYFKICVLMLSFVSVGYSGPQRLAEFSDPMNTPRKVLPMNDRMMIYDPFVPPQECDIPMCSPPCPGSTPPRKCPTNNATQCSTGCACITYCDALNKLLCYETKHCARRRFVGGRGGARRRKTTKTMKKN